MIENDLLYLLHLEKEIEKMEDQLIKGVPDNFFFGSYKVSTETI